MMATISEMVIRNNIFHEEGDTNITEHSPNFKIRPYDSNGYLYNRSIIPCQNEPKLTEHGDSNYWILIKLMFVQLFKSYKSTECMAHDTSYLYCCHVMACERTYNSSMTNTTAIQNCYHEQACV